MAAKQSDLGWDNTLTVSRGRGSLMNMPNETRLFGDPQYCNTGRGRTGSVSAYDSSEMCGSRLLRASNFENSPQESDILGQMSNLIKQIGSEIGQSIRESMKRSEFPNYPSAKKSQEGVGGHVTDQTCTTVLDASKINFILKAEVAAPPHFSGDVSDKCSIMEWEDKIFEQTGCD